MKMGTIKYFAWLNHFPISNSNVSSFSMRQIYPNESQKRHDLHGWSTTICRPSYISIFTFFAFYPVKTKSTNVFTSCLMSLTISLNS